MQNTFLEEQLAAQKDRVFSPPTRYKEEGKAGEEVSFLRLFFSSDNFHQKLRQTGDEMAKVIKSVVTS